jgi:hypothetical protein
MLLISRLVTTAADLDIDNRLAGDDQLVVAAVTVGTGNFPGMSTAAPLGDRRGGLAFVAAEASIGGRGDCRTPQQQR